MSLIAAWPGDGLEGRSGKAALHSHWDLRAKRPERAGSLRQIPLQGRRQGLHDKAEQGEGWGHHRSVWPPCQRRSHITALGGQTKGRAASRKTGLGQTPPVCDRDLTR